MAIKPLNHYSIENIGTIYDEDAMTALELAGRTAHKVNEVIAAQNELVTETNRHLETQDSEIQEIKAENRDALNNIKNTVIPNEVEETFNEKMNDGVFDGMIDEYAGNLDARVNNLLSGIPEGATTMDAEVIDIRLSVDGRTHENAGTAVRKQINRLDEKMTAVNSHAGVYTIPIEWYFHSFSTGGYFTCKPVKIPDSGLSVRFPVLSLNVGSKSCITCAKISIGRLADGEFVVDDTLTAKYCNPYFGRRVTYIPKLDGYYITVIYSPLASDTNDHALTEANYTPFVWITDNVKIYAGQITKSGSLLGVRPANVRTNNTVEKFSIEWGITGLVHKYQTIASPLPLKYVKSVSVPPDMWIGGKVYRYDPITRKSEFVENLCYQGTHPVWGYECTLDFSEYGENYFAILLIGKVPEWHNYDTENMYGTTTGGTANMTAIGFDMTEFTNKINVEWVQGVNIQSNITGVSLPVQRNINLLKSLRHKTVSGMYPRQTSAYHYIYGKDNFAGILYGAGYQVGTFFYHVSPASYYTALLNPNSCAYDTDFHPYPYGIVCSPFTSLLHGQPVPWSTFDMRYNKIEGYEISRFDFEKELHTLNRYDIMTQGYANTGHCVVVGDILNVNNEFTAMQVLESTTPCTGDNIFWFNSGMPFYKSDPENWYRESYDYVARANPAYDKDICNLAKWAPAYTEPQKVMCNRGYEGVYLTNTPVYLSVDYEVSEIEIYINDSLTHTRVIADLEPIDKNGYNVVDISQLVAEGKIRIRNNVDETEETFYIVNPSGYEVTATFTDPVLTIHTNRPNDVKYVNIIVAPETGEFVGGDGAAFNFLPDFDSNGNMTIDTTRIDTNHFGVWSLATRENWADSVNVIFKTGYDTNTFCMDAEGDTII